MRWVVLALILCAAPLRADPLIDAWKGWAPWRPSKIAVLRGEERQSATRFGGIPSLASVTKPLVAGCLLRLESKGLLDLDQPLKTYVNAPAPGGDQPLTAFATHSAGLWPDETQELPKEAWDAPPNHHEIAARALARAPSPVPFQYNNENYAVLGWVIETVTGRPFAEACFEKRIGLGGAWQGAGAFGGLVAQPDQVAAEVAQLVAMRPETRAGADADAGGGAQYTLGLLTRHLPEGRVYWHLGQLCWGLRGAGAYVAHYPNDITVAVTWSGCLGPNRHARLDTALARAALGR